MWLINDICVSVTCFCKGHEYKERQGSVLLLRECSRCGKEQAYVPCFVTNTMKWIDS